MNGWWIAFLAIAFTVAALIVLAAIVIVIVVPIVVLNNLEESSFPTEPFLCTICPNGDQKTEIFAYVVGSELSYGPESDFISSGFPVLNNGQPILSVCETSFPGSIGYVDVQYGGDCSDNLFSRELRDDRYSLANLCHVKHLGYAEDFRFLSSEQLESCCDLVPQVVYRIDSPTQIYYFNSYGYGDFTSVPPPLEFKSVNDVSFLFTPNASCFTS